MPLKHMKLAEQLLETCYHMYTDQPTGLAPEISYFNYEEVGSCENGENISLFISVELYSSHFTFLPTDCIL